MNWDRVNAENRRYRQTDYSARMDEIEERATIAAVLDAMEYRFRPHLQSPVTVTRRRSPKPVPLPAAGSEARRRLELDSARLGITPAELHRRRTHGTAAPTPPVKASKKDRDQAEARRLGVSVDELRDMRRKNAADELALHHRAVELGITVKELHRRFASVRPSDPFSLQTSVGTVDNETKRTRQRGRDD